MDPPYGTPSKPGVSRTSSSFSSSSSSSSSSQPKTVQAQTTIPPHLPLPPLTLPQPMTNWEYCKRLLRAPKGSIQEDKQKHAARDMLRDTGRTSRPPLLGSRTQELIAIRQHLRIMERERRKDAELKAGFGKGEIGGDGETEGAGDTGEGKGNETVRLNPGRKSRFKEHLDDDD